MQRFSMEQQPVFRLAVVAESFAVIRDQRDDRAVEYPSRRQPIEEFPDDLIGIGDFTVVRLCARV